MKKLSLLVIIYALLAPITAYGAIYEKEVLWPSKNVQVCFYSQEYQLEWTELENVNHTKKQYRFVPKSFRRDVRKKIERVLKNQYSANQTGIYFTGFADCRDTPDSDVVVMNAQSITPILKPVPFDGMATVGQDGQAGIRNGKVIGYVRGPKNKSFVALKIYDSFTITHEFGHIAGLRHEHIHPFAKISNDCKTKYLQNSNDKVYPTSVSARAFDSSSIMNSCNASNKSQNSKKLLSPTDIKTLKAMYP